MGHPHFGAGVLFLLDGLYIFMLDYQLWKLHQTLNETNSFISQVNGFLIAQTRRRFFWEDETGKTIDLPGDEGAREVRPATAKKGLTRAEAEAQLPKLEYLYKRNDGQPGAAWFIEDEKKRNPAPGFNAEKAGIRQCLVSSYKDEEKLQKRRGDEIRFPAGVIVNKLSHRVFNYDQIQDKITELVNKGELECCDALDIRIALKDKLHQLGVQVIDMLTYPLKMPGGVQIEKDDVSVTFERFYRRDMDEFRAEKRKEDCGDCGGFRSSARWGPKPAPKAPTTPSRGRPLPPRGTSRFGGRPPFRR